MYKFLIAALSLWEGWRAHKGWGPSESPCCSARAACID